MEPQPENLSEIGELLIRIGEGLKSLEKKKTSKEKIPGRNMEIFKRKERLSKVSTENINTKIHEFITELSNLNRSPAKEKLSQLTNRELDAICKLAEIPFNSKQMPKEELIQKILWHFFDFPSGREVIERLVIRQPNEVVEFQEAKAFFEARRGIFFPQYEGKYIAILDRNIVDVDEDFSKLAERIYGKYGYKDIFMTKVESKKTILNIPAPLVLR